MPGLPLGCSLYPVRLGIKVELQLGPVSCVSSILVPAGKHATADSSYKGGQTANNYLCHAHLSPSFFCGSGNGGSISRRSLLQVPRRPAQVAQLRLQLPDKDVDKGVDKGVDRQDVHLTIFVSLSGRNRMKVSERPVCQRLYSA